MNDLCLLISGGEFCALPDALRDPGCVIACDRGWQYAARLGLRPDHIVGDFDSAPPPDVSVPIHRLPTRKDDTDTMFAARLALGLGYRDIAVCCAFGGRLDHTLANIQTAAWIVAHGGQARLVGRGADAFAFTGGAKTFPRRDGRSLSVFALSDKCEGVTVRGTKFECEDAALTNAFPLGVSNVWISDTALVSVRSGILLVLQSELQKEEHI